MTQHSEAAPIIGAPDEGVDRLVSGAAAMHEAGRYADAVAAYRQLARWRPNSSDVHCNLGVALKETGRLDDAVGAYRQALALRPDFPEAHANLGVALLDLGKAGDAIAACRQAISLRPDLGQPYTTLGSALSEHGQLAVAVIAFRRSLVLKPDYAKAHANLAAVLGRQVHFAEAMAAGRRAAALNPAMREAYGNLSAVLLKQERPDEAVAAGRRAIALSPDYAEAHTSLGIARVALVQPGDAAECFETSLRLRPDHVDTFKNLLCCASYRDDLGNADLKEVHQRFGRAFVRTDVRRPATDATPGRRLRIGYLSSDLRHHPVATNLLPVLRHHDRSAVGLYFYAHVWKPDAATEQFRALADGWCDITGLSDAQAAERIRDDGIDILVSLAGRFDDNRPLVCAHRAAPVQIGMHDVATSGLDQMDYIVADRWLVPRHTTEFFTERPLRLPNFYIADAPDDLPELTEIRPPGPPVFGCFNNPAKITPSVLRLWGGILAALPGSTLLLKYRDSYRSEDLCRRIAGLLTQNGAASGQIVFLTGKEAFHDFLARYNGIDVALDTFPFSGSTTTFHALCMGVPVVTRPWDRMVGRWTESMLRTLDLGQLVASSDDDYVAIALALAGNAEAWRRSRSEIRKALAVSALCDGARWARHIERFYKAVWRKHCRGAHVEPPAA